MTVDEAIVKFEIRKKELERKRRMLNDAGDIFLPMIREEIDAVNLAISVLRAKKMEEQSGPLSLDELLKIGDRPVWCEYGSGKSCWCLLAFNGERTSIMNVLDSHYGIWPGNFYDMKGNGKYGLHPLGWRAYMHPPAHE